MSLAIDLDRAWADAEIISDGLIGLASNQLFEHLAFACRQRGQSAAHFRFGSLARGVPMLMIHGDAHGDENRLVLEGLLDEVDRSEFHCFHEAVGLEQKSQESRTASSFSMT